MKTKLPIISTKKGDYGATSNYSGERVRKNSVQMKCLGSLDLFDSSIGLFVNQIGGATLEKIQKDLIYLKGEVATSELNRPFYKNKIKEEDVTFLDKESAYLKSNLEEEGYTINGWVLYGDEGDLSAKIDFSSKLCRQAEISILDLEDSERENINPQIKKYINRLSDYLYWLARTNRVSD